MERKETERTDGKNGRIKIRFFRRHFFPFLYILSVFFRFFPFPAFAAPLNPHYQGRGKAAAAPKAGDANPAPQPIVLESGRWDPKVKIVLEAFIGRWGKNSQFYNPQRPPVAVFCWDGAAVDGDAAVTVFERMVQDVTFHFSDDFWAVVPDDFGRRRIRSAYEQFSGLPPSVWPDQPAYRQFTAFFPKSYADLCSRIDVKDCRAYLARLFHGFKADEARAYAKQTLDDAAKGSGAGYRLIPEIKNLARLMKDNGFDVWAVAPDAQPVLEAAVSAYGIDPSRAIGIRQNLSAKRFNGEIIPPVPVREGETAAAVQRIGRAPIMILGGSKRDADFLGYGRGLRLVIDRGDAALAQEAKKHAWIVQKAFSP